MDDAVELVVQFFLVPFRRACEKVLKLALYFLVTGLVAVIFGGPRQFPKEGRNILQRQQRPIPRTQSPEV